MGDKLKVAQHEGMCHLNISGKQRIPWNWGLASVSSMISLPQWNAFPKGPEFVSEAESESQRGP